MLTHRTQLVKTDGICQHLASGLGTKPICSLQKAPSWVLEKGFNLLSPLTVMLLMYQCS